jgi:ABC-type oligopeptide transport system ATPase subunit
MNLRVRPTSASGSGKTTTVACIVDRYLLNACGVVIVDCKACGLDGAARKLSIS